MRIDIPMIHHASPYPPITGTFLVSLPSFSSLSNRRIGIFPLLVYDLVFPLI
jgi:hypothetical protein